MTALLAGLLACNLLALVAMLLLLFQRWEDREELTRLHRVMSQLTLLWQQQATRQAADDALIGQTWVAGSGEQKVVEELMSQAAQQRQYARRGSDPFSSNAKLAP